MPTPTQAILATLASPIVGWGVKSFVARGSRSRPSRLASATAPLGLALGAAVGLAILGVSVAWPPRTGLNRLLTIVMPLAVLIECSTIAPRASDRFRWVCRVSLACGTGWILLIGSVYARGESADFPVTRLALALGILAAGQMGTQASLSRLGARARSSVVLFTLAAAMASAGLLTALKGYLGLGLASLPLVTALIGVALAGRGSENQDSSSGAVALGVVALFGLVIVGRFFGRLGEVEAVVILLAPELSWIVERAGQTRKSTAWRPWVHLAIVLSPLLILLVRGWLEFTRFRAELLGTP